MAGANEAGSKSEGKKGKGSKNPKEEVGGTPQARSGPTRFSLLESAMLDDLVAAVKRGELSAADNDEQDLQLRARFSALLAPHVNGLRNTAYTGGYSAQVIGNAPKNPILDF